MNEILKEKAMQALSEFLDLALQTKDFVVEQAPDVVRQLLWWNFTSSLVTHLICLAILIIGAGCARYLWVRRPLPSDNSTAAEDADGSNPRDPDFLNRGISLTFAAGTLLAAIVMFSGSNLVWLKILVAPKLFLIEYAAKLAGG